MQLGRQSEAIDGVPGLNATEDEQAEEGDVHDDTAASAGVARITRVGTRRHERVHRRRNSIVCL